MSIRAINSIEQLQSGDWIAFEWSYHPIEEKQIWVAQIHATNDKKEHFHVSFLYGYKSLSETIKAEDVIAIGSSIGDYEIKLWTGGGKFVVLKPNDPVLLAHQEEYKDR